VVTKCYLNGRLFLANIYCPGEESVWVRRNMTVTRTAKEKLQENEKIQDLLLITKKKAK
jgi:hypothetical protein